MLPTWANDIVIRLRPTTNVIRGSKIPDWENPNELEIGGCSVQPSSTMLSQDGRIQGITEGYTCYLPPCADVKAGDRIKYRDEVYTINGQPQIWNSPSGKVSSMQLNLERWSG